MCGNHQLFENYENLENATAIRLGDGHIMYGVGKGKIEVLAFNGKTLMEKVLINVLYVSDIKFNLFSMGSVLFKGIRLESTNFKCIFHKNNEIAAIGGRSNDKALFKMKFFIQKNYNLINNKVNTKNNKSSYSANNCDDKNVNNGVKNFNEINKISVLQLWHECLVHQNFEHIKKLLLANNIKFENNKIFCDA